MLLSLSCYLITWRAAPSVELVSRKYWMDFETRGFQPLISYSPWKPKINNFDPNIFLFLWFPKNKQQLWSEQVVPFAWDCHNINGTALSFGKWLKGVVYFGCEVLVGESTFTSSLAQKYTWEFAFWLWIRSLCSGKIFFSI